MNFSKEKINTNFYSRQIFTYGMDTMNLFIKYKILIIGLRGLGFEVCKNIILAGPKNLTIFDNNTLKINDLSSNFCLEEKDVKLKKRRDESCLEYFKELNPYTNVNILDLNEDIFNSCEIKDENIFLNFDVVVITEILHSNVINQIENVCRKNKKGFIYGLVLGLSGFVFDDFGNEFEIKDLTGEKKEKYFIKNIYYDENIKESIIEIDLNENNILKLKKKDFIIFDNVEGLEKLNNLNNIQIKKIISNKSFSINVNVNNLGKYKKGGILFKNFIPIKLKFENYLFRLKNPIFNKNFNDDDNNQIIHCLIYAIQNYFDNHLNLPELNNEKESKEIVQIAKNYYENKLKEEKEKNSFEEETNELSDNNKYEDNDDLDSDSESSEFLYEKNENWFENSNNFDEEKLLNLTKWAKSEISPFCSFIGGIISQEIVKFTGKYTPIFQFEWFDFYNSISYLIEKEKENLKINRNLLNSRYDDQIAIFGQEIQNKISNSNIFIIGSGALGCEYLKIFSLMGFSTNENSLVTITDNDSIEISNLNRQFLFKTKDIGKSKSKCACEAIKKFNKEFNCVGLDYLVNENTEKIFDENFWKKQDFIITAVDNFKARKYIDSQCVLFNKNLIDCGTEGTKANCQIFIPFVTKTYGEKNNNNNINNNDKNFAVCTLKSFPYLIEHCIEWGKEKFFEYFKVDVENFIEYFNNKNDYFKKINNFELDKKIEIAIKIKLFYQILLFNQNKNENYLNYVLNEIINSFLKNYYFDIKKILNINPIDKKDQNGNYFWNGLKIPPILIEFNMNDELTKEYVNCFLSLYFNIFNINVTSNEITKILENYFKNFDINNFSTEKISGEEIYNNLISEIELLKNQIKNIDINKINPIVFEKDDDSNNHINFINACSNLRARNYKIKECSKLKTKLISGKIIPSIASTTASITGYASLNLLTLLQTNNINYFKDLRFNLSVNFFAFSFLSKVEVKKNYKIKNYSKKLLDKNKQMKKFKYVKFIPDNFSNWDVINIKGSLNVNQFYKFIKEKYKANVNGIYLLNNFPLLKDEKNYDNLIEDIYLKKFNLNIQNIRKIISFTIDAKDDEFNIIKMPIFNYYF